ncbi:MAG: D-alanine--poly(phosphoribitol) ligase subunit DltC [Hungatella sp.]|jgi:D-alanine--poly(phosphoribitol) ligase subunit 2|nr:D-alanine--poly(phosphoribitol) ligase subunit DltC [Hungatella sp.]MCI8892988.1 D-alanine--poly(phosphoribitol) ligase subunit DltC [Eubacterium sp.]
METKILEMLAELCEDEIVKENKEVELFETGLIDSLVFAELLVEIEDRFGVVIAPSQIDRGDMNTPEKIIRLIEEKR